MPTPTPNAARDARLEAFVASLAQALIGHAGSREAEAALEILFRALRSPRPGARPAAQRLPVCDHLAAAAATARRHSARIAAVIDAFLALEPDLRWAPRASGGPLASPNWPQGHANATILGPGGLEPRDDVHIGVSLMAPGVRYPDHRHPPEEVYLVLSPGRFQHGGSAWAEPGLGGTFHNAPDILHAMASDEAPLLAIWCLESGDRVLA